MAYSRPRSRRSYRKRGGTRSAKRGAPRRRSTGSRRTYRKKPAMTKKRILDVTTVKKRDNMLPYTNLATAGAPSTTYSAAPAVLAPSLSTNPLENSPYAFLWCATARDLDDSGGNPNLRINEAQRTSTTPYMKGLKERIEIQLTSAPPMAMEAHMFYVQGRFTRVINYHHIRTLHRDQQWLATRCQYGPRRPEWRRSIRHVRAHLRRSKCLRLA
ncbi:MAG: capsid protein [Genomoviridae sp.]|nr:MAG: capsid protein [Genomoviridae sp.]